MANLREDQFLGALLGLAIGDALGRPLSGLDATTIHDRHGEIRGYVAGPDDDPEREPTGIITDETEVTLAIVESLTTNDGMIDPENINARLTYLARGDSRRWMSQTVVDGIERASVHGGVVPADGDRATALDYSTAVRGVPIGLLHGLGPWDDATLRAEAGRLARLTHGDISHQVLIESVARAILMLGSGADDAERGEAHVSRLAARVRESAQFEDTVFATVSEGGAADAFGAIAGALAGVRFGASGIPQDLIDHLDARIYLSLAAPWFYRTALRRAGIVIDLRTIS